MKYTEHALNVLTAMSYHNIGKAWIVKNITPGDDMSTIVSKIRQTRENETLTINDFESKRQKFTEFIHRFEDSCDGCVAWGDKAFPEYRGNVPKDSERPVFLYYKGNLDLLTIDNPKISVIGLLNPAGDIENREREIVTEFVKNGATIVSGLALGCDSIAHSQTLESGGKTIAILPSHLNDILPARNRKLAYDIIEDGGLLITEYGKPSASPRMLSGQYIERDRLQALFCNTIVLAASYASNSAEKHPKLRGLKLDSGARHAMNKAVEYKIPRAVMYDKDSDESNPMFDLNREIKGSSDNPTIINHDNLIQSVRKIMTRKILTIEQTSLKF
ncbi:DNA-processing protein DprA [uncultured Rikenella sp.]|uniref:DNA-processing protein DprA n=1 Tax=uncultured Rikenella sp. TaxID=368003 RepID=UPI0025CBF486|nr:DNA-processing protein DprA [uncultured Rikenella sp.]